MAISQACHLMPRRKIKKGDDAITSTDRSWRYCDISTTTSQQPSTSPRREQQKKFIFRNNHRCSPLLSRHDVNSPG
ncbi:hypothetical protein GBA52_016231 [Prunus armeniaca]|nr:hypothetical protein GBA52_016231 [Prunus armeniaca]